MGRSALAMVRGWSVVMCVFGIVYAVRTLTSGSGRIDPMPASGAYVGIGLLGAMIANALAVQHRRISALEQVVSKPR